MESHWKENGPIVIGGVGGSGTRLVASICQLAGIYMGHDLNESLDYLTYTLLFRRYTWFKNNWTNTDRIKVGLSLLEKSILKSAYPSIREILFLVSAVVDTRLHYRRDEKNWAFDRLHQLRESPGIEPSIKGWGWKEPNTYLLLPQISRFFPDLKFIFTIRHGLDMAFSKNQKQMKNWAGLLLGDQAGKIPYSPENSLKFWIAANQFACDHGKSIGGDRFMILKFEDLCNDPENSIRRMFRFIGLNRSEAIDSAVFDLPKPPRSLGRYRSQDLSGFSAEDISAVEQFGYQVER